MRPNPQTETPDDPGPRPRGRIAPASLLDVRDQIRLYREQMGLEATMRQARLAREAKRRARR